MAYSVLLASVPDEQVIAYREARVEVLEAGLTIHWAHILTSWVQLKDLREALRQAIDGGQNLRADLWHPFRFPAWHPAAAAVEIELTLRNLWSENLEQSCQINPSFWYGIEISKVRKVFRHAVGSNDGIVSFLSKPMDEERASRVSIPVVGTVEVDLT